MGARFQQLQTFLPGFSTTLQPKERTNVPPISRKNYNKIKMSRTPRQHDGQSLITLTGGRQCPSLLHCFYFCCLAVTPGNPHSSLVIQLTKSIDVDSVTQQHQNRQFFTKHDQDIGLVLQDLCRLLEVIQSRFFEGFMSRPTVKVSSVRDSELIYHL